MRTGSSSGQAHRAWAMVSCSLSRPPTREVREPEPSRSPARPTTSTKEEAEIPTIPQPVGHGYTPIDTERSVSFCDRTGGLVHASQRQSNAPLRLQLFFRID